MGKLRAKITLLARVCATNAKIRRLKVSGGQPTYIEAEIPALPLSELRLTAQASLRLREFERLCRRWGYAEIEGLATGGSTPVLLTKEPYVLCDGIRYKYTL